MAIIISFGAKIIPDLSHKTAFHHFVIHIPYRAHQETRRA